MKRAILLSGDPSPITNVEEFKTATGFEARHFMQSLIGKHQPVDDRISTYLGAALKHHDPHVSHDATITILSLQHNRRAGMTPSRIFQLAHDALEGASHINQGLMVNMVQNTVRDGYTGDPSAVRKIITQAANTTLNWVNAPLNDGQRAVAASHDAVLLRSLSFLVCEAVQKEQIARGTADMIAESLQMKASRLPAGHALREIADHFLDNLGEQPAATNAYQFNDPDAAIRRPAAGAADPQSRPSPAQGS